MGYLKEIFGKMLTVNEGINRCRAEKNAVMVDVRSKDEYNSGYVVGSINIPLHRMDLAKNRIPSGTETIYVFGSEKYSPHDGAKELKKLGYKNVIASGRMSEHHGALKKR